MSNFQMQDTDQLGKLIYQTIGENSVYETCDWVVERIDRVMKRLNSVENHKKEFKVFPNWFKNISSLTIRLIFLAAFKTIEKRIYGIEMENDADRHAIKHCLNAGYDINKCLAVFKVLEDNALNKGQFNSVLGDEEFDDNNESSVFYRIKKWFYYSKGDTCQSEKEKEWFHYMLKAYLIRI